jgi:hypothetical protein
MDNDLVLGAAAITATAAILASVFATHLANKAAERRLQVQLYHENQQHAMRSLYDVISNRKSYSDWMKEVNDFLGSFEGHQLPEQLRADVRNMVSGFWEYLRDHLPEQFQEASDEEVDQYLQDRQDWLTSLTPYEREEELAKEQFDSVRRDIHLRIGNFAIGKVAATRQKKKPSTVRKP